MPKTPTILTIAGSDTYGGAGIQVDSKTIHALGGYAFSTISAITSQNSLGVKGVYATSKEAFRSQLEAILDDIKIDAVKIGMLANKELLWIVIEMIKKYKLKNIVLDTVLVSSSGKILLEEEAIGLMIKELFPLVDVITPNLLEINRLLNRAYVGELAEVDEIGEAFFNLGVDAVLIKGGHSCDEMNAIDYLVQKDTSFRAYCTKRIATTHTHGTGCVLSSGIATHLALGLNLDKSIEEAKTFLSENLEKAEEIVFDYRTEERKRKEPII